MKLLSRYLFFSVLSASLAGVSLFVFVMLTANVLKDIVVLLEQGRLTVTVFGQLVALLLPYAVSFALPLGTLIGILIVLGRMSARQEIVAMKGAGWSLWRIAYPVILVAALGMVTSAIINNYQAPKARQEYKAILGDLVRIDPLRFIIPRTFVHDFPGYVIFVGDRQGSVLKKLWLWELDEKQMPTRMIRAEEGYFDYQMSTDSIILTLKNGSGENRSNADPNNLQTVQPIYAGEAKISLNLEGILGKRFTNSQRISNLTLPELLDKNTRLAAKLQSTSSPAAREKVSREKVDLVYQMNRRFAMAFAIIPLALLGIPLGIKASRSETMVNIGIAVALAFLYYFLMILVDWHHANPAMHPEILVWMPNSLFASLGLTLMARANRH
ncbi:MAG: LptF/LptG family permease [Verrucomicrobiota bacterium]|nr:LptF/LptG family permease [Verrucomicrobiota bacterium]